MSRTIRYTGDEAATLRARRSADKVRRERIHKASGR
jgi:hypothetical protein